MIRSSLKFLTIIVVILSTQVSAQSDYIPYYNLVNQANQDWFEKNYDSSLSNYQEAFSKVNYVHSINYAKAARSAAKLKRYELCKTYILKAAARDYPIQYIDNKLFKKFRKTNEYQNLLVDLENDQQRKELAFNKGYKRKIDSLHYIDQNVIRGNQNVTGFKLNPKLEYTDSLNFVCLLDLIRRHGFPSEQNIGYQGYRKSWVVIHHSARLPENHYYHTTLLKHLKDGEYLPENYCWVVDQGKEINNEDLIYYHWDVAKEIDSLSNQMRSSINKRRKEVGMPTIERIVVNKKSGKKVFKVRW